MGRRRRGEDTKNRILEAACAVFAEKGYRDATHAEICRRAGTNVAAINYYFESKENLYRAVFDHLADKANALHPLHGGLPASAPPEKRLHAFIHAHLSRVFEPEQLGPLHRIAMAERFEPTGLLQEQLELRLSKDRAVVLGVLREIIGPQATQRELEWCEMSIIGQCMMSAPGPRGSEDGPRRIFKFAVSDIEQLTEHIYGFSLAGVKAIRKKSQK